MCRIEEGFVRELVSKIQTMRKEADFEVTDHIRVYEKGNDRLAGLMKAYETQIKADDLLLSCNPAVHNNIFHCIGYCLK